MPVTPRSGQVIAVRGPVLDVRFPTPPLPQINEALRVAWDRPGALIVEVQSHLDQVTLRAIALAETAGLRRGTEVLATGGPLTIPVGDPVLGRLLDVLGVPGDRGPALPAETERWPIHRSPPPLVAQTGASTVFETG